MKRGLCFVALIAAPLFAATPAVTPAPNPPLPPFILTIQEIPEGGGVPIACSATSPNCSVDILSTLEITPNLANVPGHATAAATATAPRDDEEMMDTQRRAHLNQALLVLNQSLQISKEIIQRNTADKNDPALVPLARKFEELQLQLSAEIEKYLKVDPANAGKTQNEVFLQVKVQGKPISAMEQIGPWLVEQIKLLDAKALTRANETGGGGLQLRLAASRVRGAMPIHLPGYDTFDSLSPSAIQRITFDVSSAEKAQNAAEVQATAAIANAIRTHFKELTDAYKKALDDAKAKVEAALNSVTTETTKAGELSASFSSAINALQSAANQASEPTKSQLNKTAADLTTLKTTVESTITKLTDAKSKLTDLASSLDSSQLTLNAAANRPDLVLDKVLGDLSSAQGVLDAALTVLKTAKDLLEPQLTAVESDLKALAASAPAEAGTLVARLRGELLSALLSPIDQLDSTKTVLAALRAPEGQTAAKQTGPIVNLKAPQILVVTSPMPTQLQIVRTDPANDDVIDIAAQVSDAANNVIYEEHRMVRIRFFGWHSGLASGLIFVRANKAAQENLKPEAAAIWRIVFTPRADDTAWYHRIRPAIGFHSTTLHFGNDNNSVQFGLGVSGHILDDLLQVGYGWNLGVTKDRSYGYVGLGIMKLLRNALGSNSQ
jgi:hypothetical protein